MDYKKNEIYSIIDDSIELHAASWILKTEPNNIVYRIFRTTYITENLLPYMLYLKEKVIESDCMVYYDLDENRVSYIKNNILCKEDNPMFGMIFPRLTKEQKKVLKYLEDLNDEEYINALNESKDFIIPFLDQASLQIRSILNPKYFVIGGKWIKAKRFGNFYESNQIAKYDCSFKHRILKEEPRIVNRHEQPQKGAGIYAAYSYFNWELKW